MTWEINNHGHQPMMEITINDRTIRFSLSGVASESREWLGSLLDERIQNLVDAEAAKAVRLRVEAINKALDPRL